MWFVDVKSLCAVPSVLIMIKEHIEWLLGPLLFY